MLTRLDLACGQRPKDGYVGVDRVGADILADLCAETWTFAEPGTVEDIWCSHFVEHVPDLIRFMENVWRLLVPGGTITIIAPYYTSIRAWQDPTHVRAITDATWAYFDAQWRQREHLDHYPITCDFELVHIEHAIHPHVQHLPKAALIAAIATQWNVVEDLRVTLRKRA